MKTVLLLAMLVSTLSAFAVNKSPKPLFRMIYKTSSWTPEGFAYEKICAIWPDGLVDVVLSESYDQQQSSQQVSPDADWVNYINIVSQGSLVQYNTDVAADGGRSVFLAYKDSKEIVLKAYVNDTTYVMNNAYETASLISEISSLCEF